jgi:hypothetical protein
VFEFAAQEILKFEKKVKAKKMKEKAIMDIKRRQRSRSPDSST